MPDKPSVLMVCTRFIPEQGANGRERTMAFIKRSLAAHGDVHILQLPSALEQPTVHRIGNALSSAVGGLLRAHPKPLQSLLFTDSHHSEAIKGAIERLKPSAIYFDGVRSGQYVPYVKTQFPELRIICDYDDLMSRRMQTLLQGRQSISLGYLRKHLPEWLQRYLFDGVLARLILAYEYRALRLEERRIALSADVVVLVSNIESEELKQQVPNATIQTIPPFVTPVSSFRPLQKIERFMFIGSDAQLQNRQSIQYLIELWRRTRPATPLHIFGRQTRDYPDTPGVVFHGFVDDIASAYTPGSVLLAPSFLHGGVKSKVLEAMAYGVIPVGTQITFEGIAADASALTFDEGALSALIKDPAAHQDHLTQAGASVISQAVISHSAARLGELWRHAVWPSKRRPVVRQ